MIISGATPLSFLIAVVLHQNLSADASLRCLSAHRLSSAPRRLIHASKVRCEALRAQQEIPDKTVRIPGAVGASSTAFDIAENDFNSSESVKFADLNLLESMPMHRISDAPFEQFKLIVNR